MWQAEWKFNKSMFQPGDSGRISIWLESIGMAPIYASEVGIQFDWQGDYWLLLRVTNTFLDSGKKQHIGSIDFEIPCNIVGSHYFRLGVKSDELSIPEWTDWVVININIFPKLKAFVSRLGSPQENERTRPLLEAIEAWGFESYTYDGPTTPEAPYVIAQMMRDWADCHLSIATSQGVYDYIHNIEQTSPWIHREFFGAFTLGKPSIIFRERGVYFDGLLSPTIPTVEFSSMEQAISGAHILLPRLRESIFEQKKAKSSPWIWGLIGGVLTVGLATALAVSSNKRKTRMKGKSK